MLSTSPGSQTKAPFVGFMVDAKTSTFIERNGPQKKLGLDETHRFDHIADERTSSAKEGLPKNQSLLEYLLEKVREELRRPETEMYTNGKGKYKQVYELINDNRELRELLKKLNTHIDHHFEKAKLRELHEENKKLQTNIREHKDAPEAEVLDMRMQMNEK